MNSILEEVNIRWLDDDQIFQIIIKSLEEEIVTVEPQRRTGKY